MSEAKRRLRPVSSPCQVDVGSLRQRGDVWRQDPTTINRQRGRSHGTPKDFLFRLIWTDGAG